ncbi:hypothetical protein B0H19DRAFT_1374711 [Mycena capillaripes]|nr:hypothetical protein B0H19DRAFT_1374711 [Mycena capillaripes]
MPTSQHRNISSRVVALIAIPGFSFGSFASCLCRFLGLLPAGSWTFATMSRQSRSQQSVLAHFQRARDRWRRRNFLKIAGITAQDAQEDAQAWATLSIPLAVFIPYPHPWADDSTEVGGVGAMGGGVMPGVGAMGEGGGTVADGGRVADGMGMADAPLNN